MKVPKVEDLKMRRRNHGISVVWGCVYMLVLCAFCSLAVDLGRVQLAKTELRRAADGAARAGAAGLVIDTDEAVALAQDFARRNRVDGQPLSLNRNDIEFGKWDVKTKTFTVLTGFDMSKANAIHVTARRNASRGNAIPLMFASVLGARTCEVNADVIVMVVPPINVDQNVPATADPFLAGMPKGSTASNPNPHGNPDFAGDATNPRNSPLAVKLTINEGDALTFDEISGTARHDPGLDYHTPDGDLGEQIGHMNETTNHGNNYGSRMFNVNGIADAWIPINALVGVFLDDKQPNLTSAPDNLDFRNADKREAKTMKPGLKQLFFIGDGYNKDGVHQEFVAPPGATRLFLATMDYYEWNNNAGSRNIKVNRPMRIITVK